MPIGPGRRRRRGTGKKLNQTPDKGERFVLINSAVYLRRHLERYSIEDKETMALICWNLGQEREELGKILSAKLGDDVREELEEELSDAFFDDDDYAHGLWRMFGKIRPGIRREINRKVIDLLGRKIETLGYRGKSELEKNLNKMREMFGLTDHETEFCTFLYIVSNYEPLEEYFVDHLGCQKFSGRRCLSNALNMSQGQLNDILSGKLEKIGLFEMDKYTFALEDDFRPVFESPSPRIISRTFFTRLTKNTISLDHHFVGEKEIRHSERLLEEKPETSSHILLYGPPGTGKTSFAAGIAERLGIPSYGIVKGEANTTKNRRAAILACINMTNSGKGSLMVVDEADNLLNTRYSWFMRGETQDKGWLNELLEEPGVRMIWITNRIDDIEDSVLRRFAFSLHFRPFNKRQRIQLWENILRNNRTKRFLNRPQIENFARRYSVSAGAMDLAVKKAKETGQKTVSRFCETVELSLKAHETLMNEGERMVDRDKIEKEYSLDGLNIKGDIDAVMGQLEKFDAFLRKSRHDEIVNMNLLFYGPPGTGKSELARYIGERLDREIISKRVSDIQSKWVGEGEKNIRAAFEEAEREEGILIMDEAESLLFSRDRARHSWEINLTNEFLTGMERFRGILICTSNRMKDLDNASIRRFNHKLGFGYLSHEGNVIFYKKLLLPLIKSPLDRENEDCLRAITDLSPGDFKTVMDRYAFYPKRGLKHQTLVKALEEEVRVKKVHQGGEAIGF